MFAAPAEGTLKDFMEFAETGFAEHEQSPPNQRTHATEHYAELINRNRRYGRFRHASILPKPTRTPSNLTPRNLPLSIISIQAFYNLKIRQQVAEDEGQGVCWEANIIYSLLYERKLNTIKFSPVLFSPADRRFIPPVLKGRDCFIVDSQSGYNRLYAFITDQHRIHFPEQGATLKTAAQKTVQPFFAPPARQPHRPEQFLFRYRKSPFRRQLRSSRSNQIPHRYETGKNRGLTTAATSDAELLWSSQTLPPKFTNSTFCSSRLTHRFGGVCTCAVTAASPRCTSCSRSHSIGATFTSIVS